MSARCDERHRNPQQPRARNGCSDHNTSAAGVLQLCRVRSSVVCAELSDQPASRLGSFGTSATRQRSGTGPKNSDQRNHAPPGRFFPCAIPALIIARVNHPTTYSEVGFGDIDRGVGLCINSVKTTRRLPAYELHINSRRLQNRIRSSAARRKSRSQRRGNSSQRSAEKIVTAATEEKSHPSRVVDQQCERHIDDCK
jgi:hypothetical protein